jgi:hypothetical protein
MKLNRSFVGSRDVERGRRRPAEPLQESHPLQTPLRVNIESPWERLKAHFLRHEFLAATVLAVVASMAVIAPMLVLGTMAGRDFPFHLASWMDVARQWHEGTIYPQWAELANWGFGEPRFVFYPPGSWILGAALGSLLPWRFALVPDISGVASERILRPAGNPRRRPYLRPAGSDETAQVVFARLRSGGSNVLFASI